MKPFKPALINCLLPILAAAAPSPIEARPGPDEALVDINDELIAIDVPYGGWTIQPFDRRLVESAAILQTDRDMTCFLWGRQPAQDPNQSTNANDNDNDNVIVFEPDDNNNGSLDDTHISPLFTHGQPLNLLEYGPQPPDAQPLLPYSELICYDPSAVPDSKLIIILLELADADGDTNGDSNSLAHGDGNGDGNGDGDGDAAPGERELVMLSLEPSNDTLHEFKGRPNQTRDIVKTTLIKTSSPDMQCSVVGRSGSNMFVSWPERLSDKGLVRDVEFVYCRAKEKDEDDDDVGVGGDGLRD